MIQPCISDDVVAAILGISEEAVRGRKCYRGHEHIRYAFLETIYEKDRLFRKFLFERDNGICGLCGEHVLFSDMDADHIIPKSKGGPDDWNNMQVSHFSCNRSKGGNIRVALVPRNREKEHLPAKGCKAREREYDEIASAQMAEMLEAIPLDYKSLIRSMIFERYARFKREIELGRKGVNTVMNWHETLPPLPDMRQEATRPKSGGGGSEEAGGGA